MTRYVYAGGDREFPLCTDCSTRTTAVRIPADEVEAHDAWHTANDKPIRTAVVRGRADRVGEIARYLPSNYTARVEGDDVVIVGFDSHGWTLTDYVIPRLASGIITAVEVTDA